MAMRVKGAANSLKKAAMATRAAVRRAYMNRSRNRKGVNLNENQSFDPCSLYYSRRLYVGSECPVGPIPRKGKERQLPRFYAHAGNRRRSRAVKINDDVAILSGKDVVKIGSVTIDDKVTLLYAPKAPPQKDPDAPPPGGVYQPLQ